MSNIAITEQTKSNFINEGIIFFVTVVGTIKAHKKYSHENEVLIVVM